MATRTIQRTSFDPNSFDGFEFELSNDRTQIDSAGPVVNQGHLMANFRAGDYHRDYSKDVYDPSLEGEVNVPMPILPDWLTLERSENKTEFTVSELELFNVININQVGTYKITGRLSYQNPDVGTNVEDFTPSIWYFFPEENDYYFGSIDDLSNYADVYYGGGAKTATPNGEFNVRFTAEFDYTFVVDPRLGGKTSLMFSCVDYTDLTTTNQKYFGRRYSEVLNDTWFRIERLSSVVADDGLFHYWA